MAQDLETFAPVAVSVALGPYPDAAVLPLKMGQIPAFAKAIAPVVPQLIAADYLGAIRAHHETLCEAVTIGTGLDRDTLDDLYPDAFARLVRVVVEVNADFFLQHVVPEATLAIAAIRRHTTVAAPATASDGMSSSPGSAPEASPSMPASD